jgi:transposase-like protein
MNETPKQRKEEAAQLVAEGRLEYSEIADKVGVDERTLLRWRRTANFIARVEAISDDFLKSSRKLAIARKEYRLGVLNRLHTKLERLMEQRAADVSTAEAAGGDQGLIVRQYKVSGENQVTEYVFDRAVLQEMRALQEQAAKELGEFVEKRELTGKDGAPLHPDIAGQMTLEQIDARLKEIFGPVVPVGKAEPRAKVRSRATASRARKSSRVRKAQK